MTHVKASVGKKGDEILFNPLNKQVTIRIMKVNYK